MNQSDDQQNEEESFQFKSKLNKLKQNLLHKVRLENKQFKKQKTVKRKVQRRKTNIYPTPDVISTDTEDLESDDEVKVDGIHEKITRLQLHYIRKLVKKPMQFPKQLDCLQIKSSLNKPFDSVSCLHRAMRSSILKGDWNSVTNLLMILSKDLQTRYRQQLFKTVCRLNFKYNGAGRSMNIWNQYRNLMNETSDDHPQMEIE